MVLTEIISFELCIERVNFESYELPRAGDIAVELKYNKKPLLLRIFQIIRIYEIITSKYSLPNPTGTRLKIVTTEFLDLFIKLKMYVINKELMPKSNSNNIIVTENKTRM